MTVSATNLPERAASRFPSGGRPALPAAFLRRLPVFAALFTLTAVFGLWWIASARGWAPPVFLPSPDRVWKAAQIAADTGYASATLGQHAAASLGRVMAALLVTLLIAVPAGFVLALSPVGRGLLDPLIEFIRPLPPLAYLPLVIIWFGIGEGSKILVISVAMFAPIAISTAFGVGSASESQVRAARSFGASRFQTLRHVLLPAALPSIISGVRIALGAGWTTLVASELVAASRGLGYMIQSAAQFLVTDMVIVGILAISLFAFGFEILFRLIERFWLPWSRRR
ncbi:ABC transporter permease subunit [Neomegalonema sp.]|uniref:ABC transporter permease subunit n=1 Tax=Neomegalonema sp. TaxID=2039713 RepID=UPI0026178B04|nr:ABC transporter permease subunit [Neomegalonema sp.]MDD2867756.1 ABC transporter permease subunit [Neomegalonema sp.]